MLRLKVLQGQSNCFSKAVILDEKALLAIWVSSIAVIKYGSIYKLFRQRIYYIIHLDGTDLSTKEREGAAGCQRRTKMKKRGKYSSPVAPRILYRCLSGGLLKTS
jgi:hypothetical protein